MQIKPVVDFLLIEEDESKGLLATPDEVARDQMRVGTIVDLAPEVKLNNFIRERGETNEVLIGKRVIFERYGPRKLREYGERLWLVREQYIVAIISE